MNIKLKIYKVWTNRLRSRNSICNTWKI